MKIERKGGLKKVRITHNKVLFWIIIFLLALLIILAISIQKAKYDASQNSTTNLANRTECSADSDCVPASCCHPSSCTSKLNAPNCQGMYCTEVCEPGTLDCSQGKCVCENNKCAAEMG